MRAMPPLPNNKKPRRGRPKPGDSGALRRLLWAGLLEAETLTKTGEVNTKLKALNAIATLGGVYIRAIEVHDLERRIATLEAALKIGESHEKA